MGIPVILLVLVMLQTIFLKHSFILNDNGEYKFLQYTFIKICNIYAYIWTKYYTY